MANQLGHLLKKWYPQRDQTQWVLGTIYKTEGSCYRKAGAMMLFGGDGQQYGLLSGGCLESGIRQHAQRVMMNNRSKTVCYDASDEEDLAFQLGIGCGGVVHILLQPISAQNRYLELIEVYEALQSRATSFYHQLIDDSAEAQAFCVQENKQTAADARLPFADALFDTQNSFGHRCCLVDDQNSLVKKQWLINRIQPEPHILVVGGGIDAVPVINIAHELGWETSLWDPRPANARPENFMAVSQVIQAPLDELADYVSHTKVNAAILMSHNIKLDAEALKVLHRASPMQHMALLGPASRRQKVLKAASVTESELRLSFSGPAGLDIGGELPESIALSIIAECHASLLKTQYATAKAVTENTDVAA